jgi:hypothetical protein
MPDRSANREESVIYTQVEKDHQPIFFKLFPSRKQLMHNGQ